MDSSQKFVELREEILAHALPLLDSEALPAEDRFRLGLQIAQSKGSIDAYRKALQIAEGIEGDNRLLAYLDLLSDVDYVIQEQTVNTTDSQVENRPPAASGEAQESVQTEREEVGQ